MAKKNKEEERGYTVEAPISELEAAEKKAKRKKYIIIAVIVVAVAALVAGLVIFLANKFSDPRAKVKAAASNTFKSYANGDNKLFTALNLNNITKNKNYTVNLKGSTMAQGAEVALDADVAVNTDVLQVTGDVDLGAVAPIKYEMQVRAEDATLHFSAFDDYVFNYKYRVLNENSNFNTLLTIFGQLFGQEFHADNVNFVLETAYDLLLGDMGTRFVNDIKTSVDNEVGNIPFVKAPAEKFIINDSEVRAKGYSMTIKRENIVAIADELDRIFDSYYEDVMNLDLAGALTESIIEVVRNYANQFNEVTLTFYIYDDQLAAIKIAGNESNTVTLLFKGGDYRAQNMSLLNNGEEYCTIESSYESKIENMLIVTSGDASIAYEYNTDSGSLVFRSSSAETGEVSFDSSIVSTGDAVTMDFGTVDTADGYYAAKVNISRGSEIISVEGEKSVDLSSENTDELADLMVDLYMLLTGGLE